MWLRPLICIYSFPYPWTSSESGCGSCPCGLYRVPPSHVWPGTCCASDLWSGSGNGSGNGSVDGPFFCLAGSPRCPKHVREGLRAQRNLAKEAVLKATLIYIPCSVTILTQHLTRYVWACANCKRCSTAAAFTINVGAHTHRNTCSDFQEKLSWTSVTRWTQFEHKITGNLKGGKNKRIVAIIEGDYRGHQFHFISWLYVKQWINNNNNNKKD